MKNSIRRQLIVMFITASAVECFFMLVIGATVWFTSDFISNSYNSNVALEEFGKLSEQVYRDLEVYMNIKSYDNINRYLQDKALLEKMTGDFSHKASDSQVLLNEYTVTRFLESFLYYSDNAVFSHRQGESAVAIENYRMAEKAYSYLKDGIIKLNQIFFSDNINRYSSIRDIVHQLTFSTAIITMAVSIIVVFVLYFFVSNLTKPLVEISESANQIAERNFDLPLFTYNTQDEIGNICRAFNRMILSIREYIDTIWDKAIKENELREKEMKMMELYQDAKLSALQAQINPHFLFNTLNTGAQFAMMEGSDKVCDFLEKVADFYRYNLQFTGKESVLEEEIRLIESYIYIMKVRFGDRFNFYTDIRSARLDTVLPGMILQPLVENCIKHGTAGIKNGGKITLSVYDDENTLFITISDNGPGFPEEKRTELLTGISENQKENMINFKNMDSGTGVGLVNVISRLRMFFKEKDVFDIQKSEDGGTCFVIRIKNV